jgi:hypothetical protein
VRNLATALGTIGAWVTEYLPERQRLRALAVVLNGRYVDHYEYPIAGTACAAVVESKSLIHIPERLIELFPGDPEGAMSFFRAGAARPVPASKLCPQLPMQVKLR